ncbi:hypothetical protein Tco_0753508, partial [Tanacetum coccineum]
LGCPSPGDGPLFVGENVDYGVLYHVEMVRFLLAKTLVAWAHSLDSSFELSMLESNNDLDEQIKEESKEFE